MPLCAGDWVEVRSKEEILLTLDKNGCLKNMPFMPEMFAYCGRRLRVYKRGHKACDTLKPAGCLTRSLPGGVILDDARCSGSGHGGCQAQCSIFWKEAWLKPVAGPTDERSAPSSRADAPVPTSACSEEDVWKAARIDSPSDDRPRYRCQATDFRSFTECVRTRDVRQYVEDYRSRNVTLGDMFQTVCFHVFKFLGRPKWEQGGGRYADLYDWFQRMRGGIPYPRRPGLLKKGDTHPLIELNLQPGEMVRVKSFNEIRATINQDNMNRGLYFDGEMVPYCGRVFRVRARMERFIDEDTGYMRTMKTPAVILDNVWCRAYYTPYRLFCPRAIYSWWREGWLERVTDAAEPAVHAVDAHAKSATEAP